ncbi:MAG: hypothetical protein PHI12_14215 [Dehalococcoidales bacterium]|nr:hypothetical protein [Dehalococcoidales bacterium]
MTQQIIIPTEFDKAYAAGLFDGEGMIVINKMSEDNYTLRIVFTNTNSDLVEFFTKRWSDLPYRGYLEIYTMRTHITSVAATLKHRTGYYLVFNLIDGRSLLKDIMPYMILKKARAILAIKAIDVLEEPTYTNLMQATKSSAVQRDALRFGRLIQPSTSMILKPFYEMLQELPDKPTKGPKGPRA